ncbi:hypothetical protein [Streptomyces sp. ODS28]|uniref:hypothetical protein n=1 Tax=Streptomyces sp. ODS28 TaxID=3136688 RepID=UPI0031EE3BBE
MPDAYLLMLLRPAGEEWEVVRLPLELARRVLKRLGGECGDVAADDEHAYFLTSMDGGGTAWPGVVRWYTAGDWLTLPAEYRTAPPALHWACGPHFPHRLTPPQRLRAALAAESGQGEGSGR